MKKLSILFWNYHSNQLVQTTVIRRFYNDLLFVKLQIIFVRKKIKEQKLQICNTVELLVSKSAIEIKIIP